MVKIKKLKIKKIGFTLYRFFLGFFDQNHIKKSGTGFTLIELLMAITVFMIATGAITGIFLTGVKQQGNTLIYQSALDQTSYDLEFMSRNLRLAVKDTSLTDPLGNCIPAGTNYQVTRGGFGLKFINHMQKNQAGNDDCQEFFLEDNKIKYKRGININENVLPLTSARIQVTSLKFNSFGWSQGDDLQPQVTISAQIQVTTALGQRTIKIQTSISQRNLDVVY